MPRNGSGTAIPPVTVNPVSPGTTITSNWANTTVTDTYNELTNSLPRDGQAPMTAPLKIVDGSASVPGLSFNSATSSGLFRPASNTLAVTVSGVEATRWTSNGAVLIGQTSDDGISKLQVTGGAKITGAVSSDSVALALGTVALPSLAFASDLNTGIYSPGADQLSVSTAGVARVAVGATGNVGMPTVDTVARLRADISDPARGIVTVLRNSASTTGAQVQLSQNGIGDWAFGIVPATNAFAFYSGRTIAADGTERMRLDASGNLGLGGTSGGERLSVFGNARIAGGSGTVSSLVLTGGNSNFQFNHTSGSGVAQIANTGGALTFAAGGLSSQLTLNNSGFIGLGVAPISGTRFAAQTGTNRNVAILDQASTATITALTDAGSSASLRVIGNTLAFGGDGSNEHMRLTSAGTLIINRTVDSGLGRLQVSGNADIAPASADAQMFVRAVVGSTAALQLSGNGIAAGSGLSLLHDATGVAYVYNRQNTALIFGTNNTTQMVLDPSGNLGVGTTPAAGSRLDVRISSGSDLVAQVKNDGAGRAVAVLDAGGTSQSVLRFSQGGSSKWLILANGATSLDFADQTAGLVRTSIDPSGNFRPGADNAYTLGVSGSRWASTYSVLGNYSGLLTASAGVNFGNASSGTSTASGWYETGTFTPTVYGQTVSGTFSYTTQIGRFMRWGRLVYVYVEVGWSTIGAASGNLHIVGFPFNFARASMELGAYPLGATSLAFDMYRVQSLAGSADVILTGRNQNTGANATVNVIANQNWILSGFYEV